MPKTIEEIVYNKLCTHCYKAKTCHENSEYCDKFLKKVEARKPKKMTQEEWEKYAEKQFHFYRHVLKMEGEDIEITPESENVVIVPSQEDKEDFWEEK